MELKGPGALLRIYLGEKDRHRGVLLYEAIINKAKEMELAGCTIFRGIEGFGIASRMIHKSSILRLSDKLPVLIEIVDQQAKIEKAIEKFEEILDECGKGVLMTVEQVQIVRYKK
ncbi:MAG: DUF190 domain-containing protein [Calditrichaceae bacterium]|nr:DUF190 domain-containing protein [Calditrichaceae bacterium]MBN2709344.1 DUF190 domain-containing protein [Calditrichaceae bacterium]RQV94676.1 MAG: DUF190 domain-containing protein [Calditrichota bacterium]